MYIMNIGTRPVGECFLTPPTEEGEMYLTAQYYDGTNVKMIRFMPPIPTPSKDSPMQRINELEDRQKHILELIAKIGSIDDKLKEYLEARETFLKALFKEAFGESGQKTYYKNAGPEPLISDMVESSYGDFSSESEQFEKDKEQVSDTIERRASFDKTSSPYVVMNAETLSEERGWK